MEINRLLSSRGEPVSQASYRRAGLAKLLTFTLAGVAFAEDLAPAWATSSVLVLNILQASLGAYLWASKRSLPKTYLQSITFGSFCLGFFLASPFNHLAFGLGVLATVNHLVYYTISVIAPEVRVRFAENLSKAYLSLPYIGDRFRPRHSQALEGRFFTVSNLITTVRGVLIIPIVSAITSDSLIWLPWAFLFWCLDLFDGFLARKWGQATTLGKALDPMIDKFALAAVLVALWLVGRIEDWLMAATLVRVSVVSLIAWAMLDSRFKAKPKSYFGAVGNMCLAVAAYSDAARVFEVVSAACSLQLIVHYPYQAFRIITQRQTGIEPTLECTIVNAPANPAMHRTAGLAPTRR